MDAVSISVRCGCSRRGTAAVLIGIIVLLLGTAGGGALCAGTEEPGAAGVAAQDLPRVQQIEKMVQGKIQAAVSLRWTVSRARRGDREEVVHSILAEYRRRLAELEELEAERCRLLAAPKRARYVYPDRFSAVMRHIDGHQLASPVWNTGRPYPGKGPAARALNRLKEAPVASWRRELEEISRQIRDLRVACGEDLAALQRLSRRGSREVLKWAVRRPWSDGRAPNASRVRSYYEALVAARRASGRPFQQKLNQWQLWLRRWERREQHFRAVERRDINAVYRQMKKRLSRAKERLKEAPRFRFICRYLQIQQEIAKKQKKKAREEEMVDMLLRQKRAEEIPKLDARIAEIEKQIEADRQKLTELTEEFRNSLTGGQGGKAPAEPQAAGECDFRPGKS